MRSAVAGNSGKARSRKRTGGKKRKGIKYFQGNKIRIVEKVVKSKNG